MFSRNATQKKKVLAKPSPSVYKSSSFFITFSIISFAGLACTASFFRVSAFHPLASCLFCHIYAVRCCDHICQAVSERSTRPRYSSKSGRCAFSSSIPPPTPTPLTSFQVMIVFYYVVRASSRLSARRCTKREIAKIC